MGVIPRFFEDEENRRRHAAETSFSASKSSLALMLLLRVFSEVNVRVHGRDVIRVNLRTLKNFEFQALKRDEE